MKTLVIARREFLGTRNLWIAAPLLGLFAAGLPVLRGLTGQPAEDLRVVAAVGMGFGLCAVLGLILGAGLFAGDLAQKRAGFFLSRPVGSAGLYFGKLLGSLLLVFLAGALVLAPLLLLRPALLGQAWALPTGLLLTALTGLLLGHAGAIILRARSPWLLLDLATLGGFAALVWIVQSSLMEAGALPAFVWSGSVLFAGALLVLLLAGLLQVARGRGDLRAGHRVLSLSLAAGLLPLGAGGGLFAWKVLHPTANHFRKALVIATQPGGTWVLVGGHAWGFQDWGPSILLDTASGRSLPGDPGGRFTPDGRRFLWINRTGANVQFEEVLITELISAPPRTRNSGLALGHYDQLAGISADGRQVLVTRYEGGSGKLQQSMEWWDLESGRRLARMKHASNRPAWFRGNDQVLHLLPRESTVELLSWKTGEAVPQVLWRRDQSIGTPIRILPGPKMDRLLVGLPTNGNNWPSIDLLESLTGKILARFEPGPGERQLEPLFLSDGGVLLGRVRPGQIDLIWCDTLGIPKVKRTFPLPSIAEKEFLSVHLLGELAPGRVLVRWNSTGTRLEGGLDVTLATGEARPSQDGVHIWRSWHWNDPGGLWSRLHRSSDGALNLRQSDGSLKRLTAPD